MKFGYDLGVRLYSFAVRIASLKNDKAKKWISGRKESWDIIEEWDNLGTPVYWFHCASLGEFEQGRPIMEALKQEKECQIVLTFFSPSGYEIRKNYELADLVCYLPVDRSQNAKRFYDKIQPAAVFFVKYEFWAHYILTAKQRNIPIYSVAAVFRKKHVFFKWYGGFMREVLGAFNGVFVQNKESKELLQSIGVHSVVSGDTRYDRVMANARAVMPYALIEDFIGDKEVLVVGSSWKSDEDLIAAARKKGGDFRKMIIAPHEIDEERLRYIEKLFQGETVRYSNIKGEDSSFASVLIIDNIGMLMNVYQYADVAYVGGAFGSGLHNILEPACFGVPVIFGPDYAKFNEAYDFISNGVGRSISNEESFLIANTEVTKKMKKEEVLAFMGERVGATQIILEGIKKSL